MKSVCLVVSILAILLIYGVYSAPTSTEFAGAAKLNDRVEVSSKLTEISAVTTANNTGNESFPLTFQADDTKEKVAINLSKSRMTNTSTVDPRTPPTKLRRTPVSSQTGGKSIKDQSNPDLEDVTTVLGAAIFSFVLLCCIVAKIQNKEPRLKRGKGEREEDDGIWFEAPSSNWFTVTWKLVKTYISKYFNKETVAPA